MNAAEHYREAEHMLDVCAYDTTDSALECRDDERDADFLRAAQVHATLALAAAFARLPEPPATNPYCGSKTIGQDGDYYCLLPDGHDGPHVEGRRVTFR